MVAPRSLSLCRRWALVAAVALVGCRSLGRDLTPPADAPRFQARDAASFNDGLTAVPVRMVGRAPGDVQDQRLFAERLGHASLVVLVEVLSAWERRRPGKPTERYVEVRLGEALLHEVPKRTRAEQTLLVRSEDPLPSDLLGRSFILFVRWAPGERPAFHHHLMSADDDSVALIRAMVRHAEEAGALPRRGRRGRRGGSPER